MPSDIDGATRLTANAVCRGCRRRSPRIPDQCRSHLDDFRELDAWRVSRRRQDVLFQFVGDRPMCNPETNQEWPGCVSCARSSTQAPDAANHTAVNQKAGTTSPRDCAIKPSANAPIA